MKVSINKLTGVEDARRSIEDTMPEGFVSAATLEGVYLWLHSPCRTQLFEVRLEGIPTFVSIHLARHVHITPYITSKRTDRGGSGQEDRYTPVNMSFWCNAESLITMSGKRLCYKASKETREVMRMIRHEVFMTDPALANHMRPNCVLQGGYCREPKICGKFPFVKRFDPAEIQMEVMYGTS